MQRILLGGFGLGLGMALLQKVVEPICEAVEALVFVTDEEAYLCSVASSTDDQSPASKDAIPLNRTVKDSVWTAGVAHSPRRPFELKGVTPA